jgi:2-dehydropantoate 2-reductase
MRVAVLGAGAMGAIFGSALARAGAKVVYFDQRLDVIEAIISSGLFLDGAFAATTTKFPATSFAAELGRVDLALVLVDSNSTVDVADVAAQCMSEGGCALTLQNGIGNWEALADRLGGGRVLAGSTYNSGANLGPGRVRHTNLGETIIGETDGALSERVREIGRLLDAGGLPVEITTNVQGHIWSKFVHNCAINPISAVTGLRPGEIARTKAAAELLDQLLSEILAVVKAAGIRLPEADPTSHIRDHCWERYNRPSMLQHLESGRHTEIDALNAALVHLARKLGVPVPVNEAIVLIVKALEASMRERGAPMDESALEQSARLTPRNDVWGE